MRVLLEELQDAIGGRVAAVMDDEPLRAEIAELQLLPPGDRMLRRRDENHLVGVHVHPVQLVERRLVLDEADVHFAIHHLPRNLGQPAALNADADVGKLLQVVPQRARAEDTRRPIRARRSSAGPP